MKLDVMTKQMIQLEQKEEQIIYRTRDKDNRREAERDHHP